MNEISLPEITSKIKKLIKSNNLKEITLLINKGDNLMNSVDADTIQVVEYLNIKSDFSKWNKEFELAASFLEDALKYSKYLDKSEITSHLLIKLANIYQKASDYKSAYRIYKDSYKIFLDMNDGYGVIKSTIAMADVCIIQSNYQKSLELLNKAREYSNSYNEKSLDILILQSIGKNYYSISQYDKALEYYTQCIDLCEEDDFEMMASILSQIADIYDARGDLHLALKNNMDALEIRREIGTNKRAIALSLSSIANIYEKIGELNLAFNTHSEALHIFDEERDVLNMALTYSQIGKILYKQGELLKSLEFLTNSLKMQETIGFKNKGETYNLIGEIFYNQKDFEKAINYQNRAVAAYLELNNNNDIIHPYFSLFMVSISLQDEGLQTSFFELIRNLYHNDPNNMKISVHYQMANAILLKNSGRRVKLGKAEMIFDEIINSTVIDHNLVILASQQKMDMLIDELKTTKRDTEIIDEIISINEKLKVIAINQKSFIIQVESMLLESIITLLQGDLDTTAELLSNALMIAEMKNLSFLVEKIKYKQNLFNKDISFWEKLSVLKISIADKLKFDKVYNFLASSQKILFDPFSTNVTEIPKLIMIMNESGLVYFSYKFDDTDSINEHLVAAFLSAINSFSKDAFVSSSGTHINHIQHQDQTISSKKYNNMLYYYSYESIANNVGKKLDNFIEYFNTKVKDYNILIKKALPTSIAVDNEQLEEIKNIFIE